MYIDKKLWEKLKENIDNLYWDQDRMSRDGRYFLKQLDINVNEIENNSKREVYVVTNNAVTYGEIDYKIAGVCTSLEKAKELFLQVIKDVKCDSDFEELNPIKVTDEVNLDEINEEWCYEESESEFHLYLQGGYNSNNFSVQILKFDLDKELKLEDKELI